MGFMKWFLEVLFKFTVIVPIRLGKIGECLGNSRMKNRYLQGSLENDMGKKFALGWMITWGMVAAAWSQSSDFEEQGQKFNTLLYYMDQLYVEDTDMESLVETAIVNMLEEMDPHSVYIPAEELQAADEPLNGNFEGVGIQFNIFRDTIMVVSPISGGPSEKLGIMAGDRIVTVDGEVVAGIGVTNKDVQRLLKGPKGTLVTVGIKRGNDPELLTFEIIRDKSHLLRGCFVHGRTRHWLRQGQPLLQIHHE